MKKTLYFIAAAMFLAAGCQKNEYVPDGTQGQKTLTIGVADETDTRVGFDSNNAFYWQEGDQIGVLTTEGFMQMTLDSQYANQTTGVFTGNFQGAIGNYVVYPYGNHSVADGQLTYNLPASYTYTSIDQLPITLCAEQVAQVLGISRAGAYTLMHSKGFPTIQIGKRMVVPKDKLLAWMEAQSAA